MATKYCNFCDRNVNASRQMGVGTLVMCLLTLGWGVLALPFYKQKCPICKGQSLSNYNRGQKSPWSDIGSENSSSKDIQNESKKCPFCAELIKSEAVVCRYCKKEL